MNYSGLPYKMSQIAFILSKCTASLGGFHHSRVQSEKASTLNICTSDQSMSKHGARTCRRFCTKKLLLVGLLQTRHLRFPLFNIICFCPPDSITLKLKNAANEFQNKLVVFIQALRGSDAMPSLSFKTWTPFTRTPAQNTSIECAKHPTAVNMAQSSCFTGLFGSYWMVFVLI